MTFSRKVKDLFGENRQTPQISRTIYVHKKQIWLFQFEVTASQVFHKVCIYITPNRSLKSERHLVKIDIFPSNFGIRITNHSDWIK